MTDYNHYREELEVLEEKGLAHYFEFVPHGERYYKVMAICDFIVLPSTDETQSGTLARIIALNKPYITTAPMEGLTAQTLESEGGLLFTTKQRLRDQVIKMACDEKLRLQLGENLKKYLDQVVSMGTGSQPVPRTYRLGRQSIESGQTVELPLEF